MLSYSRRHAYRLRPLGVSALKALIAAAALWIIFTAAIPGLGDQAAKLIMGAF